MLNIACNIDKSDRLNRAVIGALLILAAFLGAGKIFLIITGVVLVVEAAIGWCGIPAAYDYLRKSYAKLGKK